MRPSFSVAKSVPLIGLSTPSGPRPQEKRRRSPKPFGSPISLNLNSGKRCCTCNQSVDGVMAFAAHEGIDIGRIRRPIGRQHLASAARRALVPELDVAADNRDRIGHVSSPSVEPVGSADRIIEGEESEIDYLARHVFQVFSMPSRIRPQRMVVCVSIGRSTRRSSNSQTMPIASMPTTIRADWKYCCALKIW
jgi:hypothetical protein